MTASTYAVKVTEIIDAATGNNYEYPDSFDSDVSTCFTLRMTPEQAAEKLLADYAAE